MMIADHLCSPCLSKSELEVSSQSSVPRHTQSKIALAIKQKYPDMHEVQLAQSVTSKGITYRTGMIVSINSVGGLPDFAEISQICLLHSSVQLIVKELCGWYKER